MQGCSSMAERAAYNRLTQVRFLTPLPTLNCNLTPMNPPKGKTMHEMRLMQYQRQEGLCWLCNEPLDLFQPVHSYGSCSWEHVIPKCLGGSPGWPNVVITHWECNKARGDRFIWNLKRPPRYLTWRDHRRAISQTSPTKGQASFDNYVRRLCNVLRRASQT
jgi:5-methylcytosine-specific restriction endonuclease McrA